MKVLGVDPGPHVGLANWTTENGLEHAVELTPELFQQVIARQVEWADVLVFEEFVIGGRRGSASNVTIEQIGVLKYLAALHGTTLAPSRPGAGTKFLTPTKAKALGWKVAGPDHIRSAAGHMLIYLVRTGAVTAEQALS